MNALPLGSGTPSAQEGSLSLWMAGLVSIVLWAGLSAVSVQAQEFGRIEETQSNVAYFFHARPGQATIQVSVWGTVRAPGIYEIPTETELDRLLTMAGGAPFQIEQEGRDVAITVRLYRPGDNERRLMYEARVDKMLQGQASYPTLQDDDIVVIESVRSGPQFGWRDVLSVATTAGTLTLVVFRIIRFSN